MTISVMEEDNRFTVKWQEHFGIFIISLPDTPSNRRTILVFLRSLQVSLAHEKSLDII